MNIALRIKPEHRKQVCEALSKGNVQFTQDADYILSENNDDEDLTADIVMCRQNQDMVSVKFHEICYFESQGKDVFAYTEDGQYKVNYRIYQLEQNLPQEQFIRISNSVIIRRDAIRRIRPAFSQKFILTLVNAAVVDVTRTYYYKFKEYYNI